MYQSKILLVDDSEYILKALRRTFADEDYVIFTAKSASEAINILNAENIDLLITDENMPGVTGTDLLKTMRRQYPDVIRIMITGLTDIEVAKNAINNGEIYRFFNKPWNDFELLVSVRHALNQKMLEKENTQLKSVVRRQEELLHQLEEEYPGISEKNISEDGAIIIDE